MTTDPTNEAVTARMIFTGVMLMCINANKRCEVGMIKCPNHDPKITIRTSKSGAQTNEEVLSWPAYHDLIFKVNKPKRDGVVRHTHASGDFDFKKAIDLEGKNFHKSAVTVNTNLLSGRRLAVTAGHLYTHKLSDDEFDLLKWADQNDVGTTIGSLGRIAEEVGLNIVCGEGIDILDSSTKETVKSLPSLPDVTYEIEVNNDCSREEGALGAPPQPMPNPAPTIGTDFRFYYNVVQSQGGEKFDLRIKVIPGAPPLPFPGICNTAYLSKTKTLGLT